MASKIEVKKIYFKKKYFCFVCEIDEIAKEQKANDMEFKPVKNSRKKEKSQPKLDFNLYICDKNKKSAKANAKLAMNHMEKLLGNNFATAPEFLGINTDDHFVFQTKVKEMKNREFANYLKEGSLNSWNVVLVSVGDVNTSKVGIKPKNARHVYCKAPGDRTIQ